MNSAVRSVDRLSEARAESAADRLARVIRVPTVSSAPDEVFDALRREFEACYPRVTQRLTVRRVGPRGVKYRWAPDAPGGAAPHAPGSRSAGSPTATRSPAVGAPTAGSPATGPLATGPLVLMAHADVVPANADDGWTHPPFSGTIADGMVYGRGALDDKGPLVAIFEAIESLIAEGFSPAQPLIVSIGGDEETRGTGGADAAKAVADNGETPWLVLDEGGAVIEAPLPFIAGPVAMIGVGEKGYATLQLRAVGDPGHASTPSRNSPTARLAAAITRLERKPFPARVSPPVREMLKRFASGASGIASVPLRVLARLTPLAGSLFAKLGGEAAALVRTTCAVTMLQAGSAPNVTAAEATATLNVRIAPRETVAKVTRRIRRIIRDRSIEIETLNQSDPTPLAPTNRPQFAALGTAVEASYPGALVAPYLVMATTDARHFHRRWPHVYRFAPVEMTREQRASLHGVDERISIDSLERAVEFHRTLIRTVLGAPEQSRSTPGLEEANRTPWHSRGETGQPHSETGQPHGEATQPHSAPAQPHSAPAQPHSATAQPRNTPERALGTA